ncbi:MAG: synthase [Acidimicrobiales bacterium]|nr:synthase [Acidimicrobiales bacterium]
MPRSDRFRLGLLQCGYIPPALVPTHGDYPEAFASLFAPHDLELVTWDVQAGPLPGSPADCDGWLVSGSASSAYEPLAWIGELEAFLRRLVAVEAPTVAVCFGHQVLAQAMGGRVARAEPGWGVGAHDYQLVGPAPAWLEPAPAGPVRLIASHQDQVVELPDGAVVLARTDHCPVAAYTLGPRALAIQPHPEFTTALSGALIDLRREALGPAIADAGLASLAEPLDHAVVAAWMNAFLRQ